MATPRDVIGAWLDAMNRRDAPAVAALYHADAVVWQLPAGEPLVGRQAQLEALVTFFQAFPDDSTHCEELFEAGEWAILEWCSEGTWRGTFAGRAPTGRAYALRGCALFHISDGQITHQRAYWDTASWLEQLGIPAVGLPWPRPRVRRRRRGVPRREGSGDAGSR